LKSLSSHSACPEAFLLTILTLGKSPSLDFEIFSLIYLRAQLWREYIREDYFETDLGEIFIGLENEFPRIIKNVDK